MTPNPHSLRHRPGQPGARVAALLLLALLATPALAQQGSGPALPVEITADRAEMDERQGLGTYTGDVIVIRGDMTLEADKVYVRTRDRRPYEMEAHGEPARLESPDPETGEMRIATALRIDYLLNEDRMILTDQAHVITTSEEARGKRITYDLTTDVIEAERGEGDSERVRITIQPRDDE
ncbi:MULTISPECIES: lipopolysaccharide transport periplasmic protein LptA [unclassified Thioalkalivibrio]|uniref:lipopolysaccharide transport periplasmic protein LptA n=1 Tax=unclassified Thioalkalivibrio TaxID=2621013 RepID=UPI00036FE753|nr:MULTISPECIES: lipopolysaccharide transport periplasmic protein LptA [unclassified Thioalkalivibrio]